MIRLSLPAIADADAPYVTRLRGARSASGASDAELLDEDEDGVVYAGRHGTVAIDGASSEELEGDILIVDPVAGRAERVIRRGSTHNTLLVTERCDQLCLMCSQPPKKTHVDRFALLEEACLLAEPGSLIGVSGGEPTLYKVELLGMIERVLAARSDLEFHVLSNGQFFDDGDVSRLRDNRYSRVSWGIPVYAADAALHDMIVGKAGAFDRLEYSMAVLARAGARIELRTVLVADNVEVLPNLAYYVTKRLRFVEVWSIMQLEHIGFAKARWASLFVDHARDFVPIGAAIDHAKLHGVRAQLFNFPRCTVPAEWRDLARASISDWKRRYADACAPCRERAACSGFFEWHPAEQAETGSATAVRRTKYLISSLLAAGFGHSDPAQALYVRTMTGPRTDDQPSSLLDVFRQDHIVILADHRSHSSHSSHRSGYGGGGHYSHTSHRSSTGGGYYGGTVTPSRPVYTPPPAPPTPVPDVPSPLFSQTERAAPVDAAPKTLSGRTKRFASIVRRVQIALMARQLYGGPIDGIVGPQLRSAIRKFQNQRSLPATGTITPETLDGLMVSSS